MRVCHFADVHLQHRATAGGRIVLDAQGRNVRWLDRVACLEAVVDGAIAQDCALALLAGDLFDTPKPSPAEIVAAQQALYRLAETLPAVVISGNHDPALGEQPAAIATLDAGLADLHIVTRPAVLRVAGLAVACLPFPSRAQLASREEVAGLDPAAVNALVSAKLRAIVRGLRVECGDGPAVLVAHLPIVGARLNETQTAGQEHVSLTREDLAGWDYVALGDLHLPQQVAERAYYPGATDRADFGMEHAAPGWLCVDLDGARLTVEAVPTPARRYVTMTPGELAPSAPLAGTVYRVQGAVSQEEYDALQPALARWRQCPMFTDDLTVQRQTRARSARVTDRLSPEAALAAWAEEQGQAERLPALLAEHARVAEACA